MSLTKTFGASLENVIIGQVVTCQCLGRLHSDNSSVFRVIWLCKAKGTQTVFKCSWKCLSNQTSWKEKQKREVEEKEEKKGKMGLTESHSVGYYTVHSYWALIAWIVPRKTRGTVFILPLFYSIASAWNAPNSSFELLCFSFQLKHLKVIKSKQLIYILSSVFVEWLQIIFDALMSLQRKDCRTCKTQTRTFNMDYRYRVSE